MKSDPSQCRSTTLEREITEEAKKNMQGIAERYLNLSFWKHVISRREKKGGQQNKCRET